MLDKSHDSVRAMFSDIAGRYDFLNHLLSLNQDKLWRRRAAKRLRARAGETILDLCCGTGDLSYELQRQQPRAHIIGADFAVPMLELARRKGNLPFVAADALNLPFPAAKFDAASVAFGVRNYENTRRGLEELARVVRPGGRLLVLEFMRPDWMFVQQFFAFFNQFLAPVGRIVSGHATAYNYLPQSVGDFLTRREFAALLHETGWEDVRIFEHSGGVATSFLARRISGRMK